ncbi:MAG: hypothetical protein ACRBB6_12265 [Neptuniibacter sp.]
MDEELIKYLIVGAFVLFAFIPITVQALKRRKESPPPMAANDRKLYRLWRSDPDAYQRQYGELDKQYSAAQAKKK